MKAVMISIKPEWVEKICDGSKTIEIRKTRPKLECPFKCYIYMTAGKFKNLGTYSNLIYENRMKVVAEFICDNIYFCVADSFKYNKYFINNNFKEKTCLSIDEIYQYLGNDLGCIWHISDLKIYDSPKDITEFKKENCCYYSKYNITENGVDAEECCECCVNFDNGYCDGRCSVLTRPPQSWCYVEEKENEF